MNTLEIENLTKTFEDAQRGSIHVFEDLSFDVEAGSFTTIMGPSGCGKSTVLNILAGLYQQDSGTIRSNGQVVDSRDLPFAYIFQEPRLLNWKTVGGNIKFALKAHNIPESEHEERITKSLKMVGLADEKDNHPLRLSGGMRQRVGIARAFAVDADILLMDEPFSELDELTARQLRKDVVDIWQETEKTIIFVTHSISEAVFLSDKIIFLNDKGEIFNEAEITIDRPRNIDDKELLELERDLMATFFDSVEGIE